MVSVAIGLPCGGQSGNHIGLADLRCCPNQSLLRPWRAASAYCPRGKEVNLSHALEEDSFSVTLSMIIFFSTLNFSQFWGCGQFAQSMGVARATEVVLCGAFCTGCLAAARVCTMPELLTFEAAAQVRYERPD